MRTKTLLLSAAAIAAGLLSSSASSSNVYSVNIVGYVNKQAGVGFTAMSNPLIPTGGNAATNVFPNSSGNLDFNILAVWNGVSYDQYTFDSTKTSGFTDGSGTLTLFPPPLNQNVGFLYNNQGAPGPVTFVGQVTGVVTNDPHLLATITLPASPLSQLIASPIPVAGGVITALQMPNDGSLDFDAIVQLNIVNGNLAGFITSFFDSTKVTGFTDGAGAATLPEPSIPIATSFFFVNYNATAVVWNQNIDLGP